MIYEKPSETHVLTKDNEVVFSGHKQEAERRYRNAIYNKRQYNTNFKYEVLTEKEWLSKTAKTSQPIRQLKVNNSMLSTIKNIKNNGINFAMIDFIITNNTSAGFLFHRSDENIIILAKVFNDLEVENNKCYAYSFKDNELDSFFTKEYEFLVNENETYRVSFID